jgi:hypothetical protein
MSALLERLHAIFDGTPVVLAAIPTAADPSPNHLRSLADLVAALANEHTGGVLVLGIDPARPHRVRGVADPGRWTAALHHLADTLVPPIELEVEVGLDEGRAIVAAHVPYVPVGSDLVRRVDGPPVRLVGGRPVPCFRPLPDVPPARVAPMLAPVVGSDPTCLDADATRALAPHAPASWSLDTRAALARDGVLAADGVALTRVGLLLAGLPEHRADRDGVVLETPTGVVELARGWSLLREDLRTVAGEAGVRHVDLVADLVLDVLVRTAGPTSPGPVVVDLTPELLTIEAPSPIRDDPELLARMKRWARWRPERWKAVSVGWHLPVRWERDGSGLRIVAHLVRPERPVDALPRRVEARVASTTPTRTPTARVVVPATATMSPIEPGPVVPGAEASQPRADRASAVLALLADGRAWTRRELDAHLGWSRSTLRTVLEHLVRTGQVTAAAPSPRSPFQAYRVA